jgi:nitric oxide reductase subunit B
MAWSLMKLLGVRRKIIQTWLYIEVALMFGSGILGLGHHYFWIGTPEYWLTIGGFFSALEPIPWWLWWCMQFTIQALTLLRTATILH